MSTSNSNTPKSNTPPAVGHDATAPSGRSWRYITGVVLSVLVGIFLLFDVIGKLARPQAVIDSVADLGFPTNQTYVMGGVLLVCLVVFVIPRTAVLGAVGITAYLGGAVTANLRIEAPLVSTTLFAAYVGVVLWIGLLLRRPELAKVAGLRR